MAPNVHVTEPIGAVIEISADLLAIQNMKLCQIWIDSVTTSHGQIIYI